MTERFKLAPLAHSIIQDSITGKSHVFHSVKDARDMLTILQQYARTHRSAMLKQAELERKVMELQSKLDTYIRIEAELDITQKQLDMCREELDELED